MRRFVAHPARYLHPIPDDMSYRLGALVEPLSVAYNAISRGKPYLGQPVLVAGAGPIGLATAICARAAGCHPICITDLDESRLAQAQALGFDKTVAVEMSWTREQVADKVREVMGKGCAPSLGFECTGAESSLNAAFYVSFTPGVECRFRADMQSLRPGGTIVQVGCGRAEVSVPLMQMVFTEADLRTTFRYRQSWPTVILMAAAGMFGDCEKMITHTYPVEKSVDAFEACIDKSKMAIKVQVCTLVSDVSSAW
jgi:L-iditol 2-dehydrogenase